MMCACVPGARQHVSQHRSHASVLPALLYGKTDMVAEVAGCIFGVMQPSVCLYTDGHMCVMMHSANHTL